MLSTIFLTLEGEVHEGEAEDTFWNTETHRVFCFQYKSVSNMDLKAARPVFVFDKDTTVCPTIWQHRVAASAATHTNTRSVSFISWNTVILQSWLWMTRMNVLSFVQTAKSSVWSMTSLWRPPFLQRRCYHSATTQFVPQESGRQTLIEKGKIALFPWCTHTMHSLQNCQIQNQFLSPGPQTVMLNAK